MAGAGGHHVPGTPYSWRHGWEPLNVTTAIKYRKGKKTVERLRKHPLGKAEHAKLPKPKTEVSQFTKLAQSRENRNPFGRDTIARDPDNIKSGQSVYNSSSGSWMRVESKSRYGRSEGYNASEPRMTPRFYPADQIKGYVRRHNRDVASPSQPGTHKKAHLTPARSGLKGKKKTLG